MTDNQITTEGNTVGEALRKAAEQLGIPVEQVDHKLDLSHFRNESGRPVAVDSVKIICWAADPSEKEGASPPHSSFLFWPQKRNSDTVLGGGILVSK